MKSMFKILGIIMILAVVSLSGCIGEDVTADEEIDVVIVDDVVDEIVDGPVADESDDAIEVVDLADDEPEEEVITTPSSSGGLVAGVDGSPGHGAEIKAKREAAEAARLAMLNALSDDLPNASDAAFNASANFTGLNESYINETTLMAVFLTAEDNLRIANASTMEARTNLSNAEAAKAAAEESYEDDMIEYDSSVESCPVHGPDAAEDESPENCTCLEMPSAVGFHIPALRTTLLNMEGQESLAEGVLNDAMEAMTPITVDTIEAARLAMEESMTTMEEAFVYLDECQAAFDLLHPVVES